MDRTLEATLEAKRELGTVPESSPETPFSHEDELVHQAKDRSPVAWAQIHDAYYPKLYRYALARTQNPTEAEDLASTVFLEALKGIDSYTPRGRPFLAWLYGIARNVVNQHLRSARRKRVLSGFRDPVSRLAWWHQRSHHARQQISDSPAWATGEGEGNADPSLLIERLDLRQALNKLNPEQREVTALHFLAGFTIPEVARLLGKKERAV